MGLGLRGSAPVVTYPARQVLCPMLQPNRLPMRTTESIPTALGSDNDRDRSGAFVEQVIPNEKK
jgi:hypothetical protein